jgi:AcrR family transcriptional regulator
LSSLREQKKARTREALVEAAWKLFRARGFERTTIDQIASAADVARSTFFRYFPNKEAVAFPYQHERLRRFGELLAESAPAEAPLGAIWRASMDLAEHLDANQQQAMAQFAMVQSAPALITADREFDHEWEATIATFLRGRGVGESDARIIGATIFGVLRITLREWCHAAGEEDIRVIGRKAFELLQSGIKLV